MAAHDDGSRAVEESEQPVGRPDPSGDAPDLEAVYDRLDRVDDPELDRSIVDLEYVETVEITGTRVEVGFVLPTAWCSPAFAWMMATGIRDEVGSLPGVETVRVDLRDHMHEAEINRGVEEGLPFEEAFEDAEDGIEAVREKLDAKARLARQFDALDALRDAGLSPAQIADLRLGAVDLTFEEDRAAVSLRDDAVTVTLPAEPLTDYLEKARATGLVTEDDDRLFADRDGEPFEASEFEDVRRQSRVAAANVTGQGAICSALHEARNGVAADD
ncbi:MAG: iron-sulfur cluster assembly protein [Haloarculaceae archaeon]